MGFQLVSEHATGKMPVLRKPADGLAVSLRS
jgi:hypothetical protein